MVSAGLVVGAILASAAFAKPPEIGPLCAIGVITNTAAPSLSGNADVGGTLTTSNGSWTSCQSAITGYTYQWFRGGSAVGGAVGQSYGVTTADAGQNIFAQVTAHNEYGPSSPASSNTVTIPGGPSNTSPPTVSGTGDVDTSLLVSNGSWAGDPTSYGYQWYKNGSPIGGATANSYLVASGDQGTDIYANVTASNHRGSGSANSNSVPIPQYTNTWGYRVLSSGCCGSQLLGNRVTITTPSSSTDLTSPLGGAVYSVQAATFSYGMQAGFGRGNVGFCGYREQPINFVEQRIGQSYSCFFSGNMSYNRSMKYSLWRLSDGWQGFIDGVAKGPRLTQMLDASEIRAFGELSSGRGRASAFFGGAPPSLRWQRYNGNSWVEITGANICNEDGNLRLPRDCMGGRWVFGPLPDWRLSHE